MLDYQIDQCSVTGSFLWLIVSGCTWINYLSLKNSASGVKK